MTSAQRKTLYAVALLYTICIYGPMAMMSIGAGVVLVGWIVVRRKAVLEDLSAFRKSPLTVPTLFFGFACLWSLAWAKLSGLEFMGARPTITWDDTRKTWHLLFPFVLAPVFLRLSDVEIRRVAKLWFFLGLASAFLGIAQYYFPIYDPQRLPHLDYDTYAKAHEGSRSMLDWLKGSYHATGFTGFHLSYAAILAFPAAVALALLAVLYRRSGFNSKTALVFGAVLVFFFANVFTYSKVAWAAMPLTVALIAAIGFKGWPRYALIGLTAVFCVAWAGSAEFRLRLQGTNSVKDRLEVWSANYEMIKQHPLFGVGWHRNAELSRVYYQSKGINGFESHAHNNFIDQWATTGVFGLFGFGWLSAMLVGMCLRVYRDNHDLLWRSLGLGLLGGWFCLHLEGLTQANWWDAKVLHQIGWTTAITMEVYRRWSSAGKKIKASESHAGEPLGTSPR